MSVTIKGVKELKKALQEHQKFNKTAAMVVKLNGAELQQKAQRNAPVDTGFWRRSIWLGLKDSGMTAEVAATAEYSGFVEYGTR